MRVVTSSCRALVRKLSGTLLLTRLQLKLRGSTRGFTIGHGFFYKIDEQHPKVDVVKFMAKDEILDNIMVNWFSNSGASSARLYWEDDGNVALRIVIQVGMSIFLMI
jgi:hypothetical protein